MRHILTIFLAVLFPISAFSQPAEIPLWAQGAPNSNGIATPEESMENGRAGNVSEPKLYSYFLPSAKQPTAAVVVCPGGGYARLAMQHEGHDIAKWLNEQGIAAFVLKYRMPNGHHDVPLSDAQQALRLVRQNAKAWNVDPKKVGIAGFSAGGHLASTAATHFTDSATRPDFAALFYPVVSMAKNVSHGGSRKNLLGENPSTDLVKAYSNALRVTPQTPPTLLFHSDDDKAVPVHNSLEFYAGLKQNGVPAALYIFPTGGHGWGAREAFAYSKEWRGLLMKWLENTLK